MQASGHRVLEGTGSVEGSARWHHTSNIRQLCTHMVPVWHVMTSLTCVNSFEGLCLADYELVLKGGRRLDLSWLLEPSKIGNVKVRGRHEA